MPCLGNYFLSLSECLLCPDWHSIPGQKRCSSLSSEKWVTAFQVALLPCACSVAVIYFFTKITFCVWHNGPWLINDSPSHLHNMRNRPDSSLVCNKGPATRIYKMLIANHWQSSLACSTFSYNGWRKSSEGASHLCNAKLLTIWIQILELRWPVSVKVYHSRSHNTKWHRTLKHDRIMPVMKLSVTVSRISHHCLTCW